MSDAVQAPSARLWPDEKRLVIALDIEKRLLKRLKARILKGCAQMPTIFPLRDGSVDCVLFHLAS